MVRETSTTCEESLSTMLSLANPLLKKDEGWTGAVADGWRGAIAELDGTLGAADGEDVSWKRNKGREEE